ncbi:dipeptidyl aminopeptidase/acylaminoacyl peptidase [Christiangramia gaetbulicola]|uniref:Dipeptidyl aminopeptidase/acylaminoacyl peptidase n=1 Tax=Christiangramia gaetbulicola TaxID=703340 RepID=A0A2T6AER6_9FLAO|nr:prolyl oligopeptidase family serine peptidase [Christiangramia gaetbulicola]PTX42304.1 dipeptidyl aminopeptidase/acylaminoacyl peptidase [Christiangramia gaetbulicola]
MNRVFICLSAVFLFVSGLVAQENLDYQKPPKEILDLIDVPLAPATIIDSDAEMMVFLYRDQFKSIAELSEEEMRLGGLRINPVTNINSRARYYNDLKVKTVSGTTPKDVTGLPESPRLTNFTWSPDESMIAFTHTTNEGVELWVLDVEAATAKKLTEARLNANMRSTVNWFRDNSALLVTMLPSDRKKLIDTETSVPTGPTVSVSDGKEAQNRTYQDLLKNPNDEYNFEQLARSELVKVSLDGKTTKWMAPKMYSDISFSPDGNYVMITNIKKPFSYLVPYYRFPSETNIYDAAGKLVNKINEVPLIEDLPKGFMAEREGKRDFTWRDDQPATLVYVKALDRGDPEVEAEYRDEYFQIEAPFNDDGRSLIKVKNRGSRILWGDKNTAIASDYWWNTRNTKTYVFDPSNASKKPEIIFDRNYQDVYSDPGSFVTKKNKFGKSVLNLDGEKAFLLGSGYTEEGQFPFVDKIDLEDGTTKRLYQSEFKNKKETLVEALDMKKGEILVRIESSKEYPNYFIRNINSKDGLTQITTFENPFKSLEDVSKEVITYKREDGLELNATLYLPAGYDKENPEKLPMFMWAYPREFKDKNSASQNTSNANDFTYPYYGSPIYWVNRGYVVLDDASFPIVGEGDEEPNDSFRKQLVSNAKAAIDAVDEMGYVDRDRVAVGGHSYGAFMTANLLSHSDLFAAGIARSGAYNRTLTPFGFQSEERSYWEAPDVYYRMSPFMHTDKMKTPLLLIHGEADNNSGTYPMQSERYFNALKGLGATARLVMLPKESHGYSAKESVLHVLWEQDQWLEKYVKNKKDIEAKDETPNDAAGK